MPKIGGDTNIAIHENLAGQENSTLLRYMSFEKFKLLLSDGLHLTRADILNKEDPFEGEFVDHIYRFVESCLRSYGKDRQAPVDSFKCDASDIRELSYISCWTLADDENVALWKLYGDIAVQTKVAYLKSALENALKTSREESCIASGAMMRYLKKEIVKVDYIDHRDKDETVWRDMLAIRPRTKLLHYKNVGYKYEGEIRVIFDGAEFGTSGAARGLGERCYLHVQPQEMIRKILISPFVDQSFFDRVKNDMEMQGSELHEMSKLVEWSALKFPPGVREMEK